MATNLISSIKVMLGAQPVILGSSITNLLSSQELLDWCGEINVVGLVFDKQGPLKAYHEFAGERIDRVNLLVADSDLVHMSEVDGLVISVDKLSAIAEAAKLPSLANKPLIASLPADHSLAIEAASLPIDSLWFKSGEDRASYVELIKWWVNYSTLPVIAQSDNNEQNLAALIAAKPDIIALI